jgi:hypothetical protein
MLCAFLGVLSRSKLLTTDGSVWCWMLLTCGSAVGEFQCRVVEGAAPHGEGCAVFNQHQQTQFQLFSLHVRLFSLLTTDHSVWCWRPLQCCMRVSTWGWLGCEGKACHAQCASNINRHNNSILCDCQVFCPGLNLAQPIAQCGDGDY